VKKFLEIGQIVATQGLKGEVRVKPYCDYIEDLIELEEVYIDKDGKNTIKIEKGRVHKSVAVLKFFGVDRIEEAEKFKNVTLYVDRDDFLLDNDTFFIQDIIGSTMYDRDTKEKYGTVIDIVNYGASDIYHVESDDKRLHLIPLIDDINMDIDIDTKTIYITPIKGLFDNED